MSNFSIADKVVMQEDRPDAGKTVQKDDGIVFMVQVASASARTDIKPVNFKGLTDIIEIPVQERYKYATGRFSEYAEAVKYRRKIEEIYPDAFVIALKDNKILPLQQALDLKKKN